MGMHAAAWLSWVSMENIQKFNDLILRPVVTYSLKTWTLTIKDENNLRIFERQILMKILFLYIVSNDNVWRI